jgi:Domain of unknown function (DUF4157)
MTTHLTTSLKAVSVQPNQSGYGVLRRKAGCDGECEECRKKTLQRKARNSGFGTQSDTGVPPIVHEVLRSPGQPLDAKTRAFMEPRFGHDFSQVRVHTDARAADAASAVAASAFTVGHDVVLGADQHHPSTSDGSRLFAHELAHVVQQAATSRAAGSELRILNDVSLESEADAAATQLGGGGSISSCSGTSEISLQRQTAGSNKSPSNDDCSGWEQDPVSFSTHVAKYVAKMQIAPNVEVTADSVACKDGHRCDVKLSNGVVMRVAWEPSTRLALGRWDSKDAVLRSLYTYSCHDGQLILTFKDFKRGPT